MSRDLNKYTRETNMRLVLGAFLVLLIVGIGLVWLIYGEGAAGMGLVCVLAGLSPVILILIVFVFTEWILKNAGRK